MNLNFDTPTTEPVSEVSTEALKGMQTADLESLFKEKIGYDPKMRFLTLAEPERRALLIGGIMDPAGGKQSIADWDAGYEGIGDAWSKK